MGCFQGLVVCLVCFTLFPSRVFCENTDCDSALHYCLLPKVGAHLILCVNHTSTTEEPQYPNRTLRAFDDAAFCKTGPTTSMEISPELTSNIWRLAKHSNGVSLRCGRRSQFHNCTLRVHLVPASAMPNVTFVYSGGRRIGDRASLTCTIAWKTPGTTLLYTWFKSQDDVFF